MKAAFYSLAILLMATAGLSACSDDDSNDKGNLKEYALQVKFNLEPNDSTVVTQLDKAIESAMRAIGLNVSRPDDLTSSQSDDLADSQSYLYLAARDSADAAPKIQEMGKKLKDVLYDNASYMYGDVSIMAIEKQQLETVDSKQYHWSRWYKVNYPAAENSIWGSWLDRLYFVYSLQLCNYRNIFARRGAPQDDMNNDTEHWCYTFRHRYAVDLNDGAGGSYLYLVVRGVTKATHPTYGKQLITDVVMLNTGGDSNYPKSVNITKDGVSRCYYPVFTYYGGSGPTKNDLNNGAGGPYLWMYYTTDPRDGWVLVNKDSDKWYTQVTREKKGQEDGVSHYYMHAYKKNASGEWADYGTADMNEGTDGDKLMLALAFLKLGL